uniref:non-specific serine/threonine protein kinase n=1 Tax=Arcella intermedia TaxID=1963864 RepID=A0A6B2LN74_9EUKA
MLKFESLSIRDFDIGPKIGAGGFSDVYLCWKKGNPKTLAMKVVKKKKLFKPVDDGQSKRRENQILREKKMLELQIPHALNLHYAFQDYNALYLVMDYCPGGPLFDLIQEHGPMSEEDSKFYISQIIAVVNYLHKLGYLHRQFFNRHGWAYENV